MTNTLLTDNSLNKLAQQMESRAVYLLSIREHGDLELLNKLTQKFPEASKLPNLVKTTLDTCQNNNWQNDERYIEAYVRQAIAQGQGYYKIRQTLTTRSSHLDLINTELELDEETWIETAQTVLEKKYGSIQKPPERKEQAKRMRFLQSRGFTQSQIYKAFTLIPA